jgi:hypothetical protein
LIKTSNDRLPMAVPKLTNIHIRSTGTKVLFDPHFYGSTITSHTITGWRIHYYNRNIPVTFLSPRRCWKQTLARGQSG